MPKRIWRSVRSRSASRELTSPMPKKARRWQMDDFDFYQQVWVSVLHNLLAWPIEKALAWTNQYSHRRNDVMLFHETPIWFVTRELVPRGRRSHLSFAERRRLTRQIEKIFLDRDLNGVL